MLRKLSKQLLLLGFFVCFSAALSSSHVSAASNKITVAPFLQSVEIGAAPTKNIDITYSNDSDKKQELTLAVADFGSLDKSGGVAFVGSEATQLLDKYKLSSWISLSKDKFTLEPGKKMTVTAILKNEASLKPGGHYAAVVATVVTPEGGNNHVNLKQKISSLIFATKTGGEKYDLRLDNIDHDGGLFSLPNEAYLTMRATGNVHIVPRGIVYLKTSSGTVVAKGAINAESGYVLPETNRIFTVKLTKLSNPKPWERSFYLQADYRYEGIDMFASKKLVVRYVNIGFIIMILTVLVAITVVIKKRPFKSQKKSK